MKRLSKILVFCLTVATIFAGCFSEETKKNVENLIKIGMIAQLNASPEQMDELMEIAGVEVATNYYDSFNSMQTALASKKIDEIQTYGSVANYMTETNSNFEVKKDEPVKLIDAFCFAVREGDLNLKNEFDSTISSMEKDGSLDALVKKYIKDLKGEPPAVEIAKIDGADTIKVGITGDLPPLDMILSDGTPAGFNTAVLAEISRRIGKNIELVQIESGARAAALTSKKIDVIFWVAVPAEENSKRPADIDKPQGIEVTDPYYKDTVVHVNLSSLAAVPGN